MKAYPIRTLATLVFCILCSAPTIAGDTSPKELKVPEQSNTMNKSPDNDPLQGIAAKNGDTPKEDLKEGSLTHGPAPQGGENSNGNTPERAGTPEKGPLDEQRASEGEPPIERPAGLKSDLKEEKVDVREEGDEKTEKRPRWEEDRRWLIKQREQQAAPPRERKPVSFQWEDEDQKIRCETYIKELRESLLTARYHSIHGDSCNTKEYAASFLSLAEKCKKDCPDRFLEENGFKQQTVENMNLLYISGKRRCLGPVK